MYGSSSLCCLRVESTQLPRMSLFDIALYKTRVGCEGKCRIIHAALSWKKSGSVISSEFELLFSWSFCAYSPCGIFSDFCSFHLPETCTDMTVVYMMFTPRSKYVYALYPVIEGCPIQGVFFTCTHCSWRLKLAQQDNAPVHKVKYMKA